MEDEKKTEEEVKEASESKKEESNTEAQEKKEEKTSETQEKPEENQHKDKKSEKKIKKNGYEVKLEKLETEIKELKDKNKKDSEEYLKARADLDNVRKRLFEQSVNDRMYASQGLVTDLINPLDMLFKIVDFKSDNPEVQNYVFGFKMITDQVKQILEKDGLKEIKALNEKFDSQTMQAMSTEKRDGVEPGIVIEVLQNGYMYKDKMIKPAMVKVSE